MGKKSVNKHFDLGRCNIGVYFQIFIIEEKKIKFILSGSSARKLRESGVNLQAGRALTYNLFPLVSKEVGFALDMDRQIACGMLPNAFTAAKPQKYLQAYAETYLKEEILSHFAPVLICVNLPILRPARNRKFMHRTHYCHEKNTI